MSLVVKPSFLLLAQSIERFVGNGLELVAYPEQMLSFEYHRLDCLAAVLQFREYWVALQVAEHNCPGLCRNPDLKRRGFQHYHVARLFPAPLHCGEFLLHDHQALHLWKVTRIYCSDTDNSVCHRFHPHESCTVHHRILNGHDNAVLRDPVWLLSKCR